MTLRIIFVASRKGGSGKTTISINLACQLKHLGHRTALFDMDPQGSAQYWSQMRKGAAPPVYACEPEDLIIRSTDLEDEGYSFLIVDSPPVEKRWLERGLQLADLVLVPCRPTPLDVLSATSTANVCQRLGKTAFWVLNAAPATSSAMVGGIKASLQKVMPAMRTVIHQRNDVAASLGLGQSVAEFNPQGKSAGEFQHLTSEVLGIV